MLVSLGPRRRLLETEDVHQPLGNDGLKPRPSSSCCGPGGGARSWHPDVPAPSEALEVLLRGPRPTCGARPSLVSGRHPARTRRAEQPGRAIRPLSWRWSRSCPCFCVALPGSPPTPPHPGVIRGGLCPLSRVSAGTRSSPGVLSTALGSASSLPVSSPPDLRRGSGGPAPSLVPRGRGESEAVGSPGTPPGQDRDRASRASPLELWSYRRFRQADKPRGTRAAQREPGRGPRPLGPVGNQRGMPQPLLLWPCHCVPNASPGGSPSTGVWVRGTQVLLVSAVHPFLEGSPHCLLHLGQRSAHSGCSASVCGGHARGAGGQWEAGQLPEVRATPRGQCEPGPGEGPPVTVVCAVDALRLLGCVHPGQAGSGQGAGTHAQGPRESHSCSSPHWPWPPPHSALHFPRVSIAFRGPGGTQDSHLVPPRATPGPLPMAAGSSQGYLGGARPRVPWGIRPRAVSLSGLSASCKGRTPSPEPAGGRKQRLVRDPEGAGQAWPRGQGSGCRGPQGCLCPFGVSMSPQAGQDHPPGAAWPQQSPAPLPTAGPGQAFRSQPWPPGGASLVFARGLGAAGRGERGEQGRPLFSCAQEPASGQGPGDEGPPSSGRWARRRHAQSRSERAGAGRGHKPASDTRFSACCASFNSRSLS